MGRHDNYGFALAAQPGESKRRPATNTNSRFIVQNGLPALGAPGASIPDGRTIRRNHQDPSRIDGAGIFIPVTNLFGRPVAPLDEHVPSRAVFQLTRAHFRLLLRLIHAAQYGTAAHWFPPVVLSLRALSKCHGADKICFRTSSGSGWPPACRSGCAAHVNEHRGHCRKAFHPSADS